MPQTVEEQFRTAQLKKRDEFHEIIHAAFVLDTSVSFFLTRPKPTEKQLSWLAGTYPNSKIEHGTDQGGSYCTITPKF